MVRKQENETVPLTGPMAVELAELKARKEELIRQKVKEEEVKQREVCIEMCCAY